MHLLHSNPISGPEFISLSLFMKPGLVGTAASRMGNPMLLASPISTISHSSATSSVKELHNYLNSLFKSFLLNKSARQSRMTAELIQEDDKLLQQMQIFRPCSAHGVALHYRLIRDPSVILKIASIILASSKSGQQSANINSKVIESEVVGVVFCIGLSGLPLAHSSSSLQYGLSQKLNDCLGVLSRIGTHDVPAAKMLLSTLLVTEDEYRKSNEMAEAAILTAIPEGVTEDGAWGGFLKKTKNIIQSQKTESGTSESNFRVSLGESSADYAREMVERLRVLSVAETDTFLKRYETSGQERKANLDLAGNKSRFRRKKTDSNIPDLEQFDYKGPVKEHTKKSKTSVSKSASSENSSATKTPAPLQVKPGKKDTVSLRNYQKQAVPAISVPRRQVPGGHTQVRSAGSHEGMGHVTAHSLNYDDGRRLMKKGMPGPRRATMDSAGDQTPSTINSSMAHEDFYVSHSQSTGYDSSVGSMSRLQVNIALNEDLTCSYKASKMSSCNVEGVVQVQIKANSRSGIPFQILLRDPSRHLQSLQENKKYADDITHAQVHDPEDRVDRRFTVSIPQTNNYFPVLRYKCSQELRPVPIRVQTRVKADRSHCRVALQISSNPHNEGSLTDLTIIMGVTTEIIGESLVTQPAGGVWNASKRSVIWCVSELGDGEKFQLQAKFEMNPDIPYNPENTPKFPVLVRCQCMFAQLSDIEVEVRDIPEVYPAEVTMKVARRFRLSHQERS